ncbi:MerR family transcriptional regulator [Marininema halotolerans]|uniref:MerR family transcriptional regulator n=1 Tax=Marininema halotolerans TaxID=1155944 RepID=UPI0031842B28
MGELAQLSGISPRSLRYYEKKNLLHPLRTHNGYREYPSSALEQVKTIQLYLNLGFTTEQIASFLTCVLKNKEAFCQEILPYYEEKLEEIDKQISLLLMIKSNVEERVQSIQQERKTAFPPCSPQS